MQVEDELIERYDEIATSISGFETSEELIKYVLEAFVDEVEDISGEAISREVDTNTVEDRLEDLGYLE